MTLSGQFYERLERIVPSHLLETVLQSFQQDKRSSFRFNSLQEENMAEEQAFLKQFHSLETIDWHPKTYSISNEERHELTHHSLINQGRIFIQNPSSIYTVSVLELNSNQENLDLAAAPGGKSSLMASYMQNQGRLACVEAAKPRFFKLKRMMDQLGVNNHKLYLDDGRNIGRKCPERFDRVLLDAPCSSETRLHETNTESKTNWSLKKIKSCGKKQKQLLSSAYASLKPGGIMVYSTCSFAPEENEAVVSHLLDNNPSAELVRLQAPESIPSSNGLTQWEDKCFHPSIEHCLRIWPDQTFNGFFLCKIKKKSSQSSEPLED